MEHPETDISQFLQAWADGDPEARDRLMPLVFDELRAIARHHFQLERPGHTLQPTAVVNELYLRLAAQRKVQWRHRREFFAVAARLIRRILVDHARKRQAGRRGEGVIPVSFEETLALPELEDPALLALDDALEALAREDPRAAEVVELHAFGGLTFEEIAASLGAGRATVLRDWKHARLWLRRQLASGGADL